MKFALTLCARPVCALPRNRPPDTDGRAYREQRVDAAVDAVGEQEVALRHRPVRRDADAAVAHGLRERREVDPCRQV
jgi:hypothetical protein